MRATRVTRKGPCFTRVLAARPLFDVSANSRSVSSSAPIRNLSILPASRRVLRTADLFLVFIANPFYDFSYLARSRTVLAPAALLSSEFVPLFQWPSHGFTNGRLADLECHTSVRLLQRRALVYRDVIGLVALDFILRLFFARVVCIPFVVEVFVCTLIILR